jgi:hypothetical protein
VTKTWGAVALAVHSGRTCASRLSTRAYLALRRPRGTERQRIEHFVTLALVAAAVVALICVYRYIDPIYEDDAAISLGYARSLARGWGLRVTHHSQVVEGFSNPLWTLFAAAFYLLRLDPFVASAYTGVALGAGCIVLVAALGPTFEKRAFQLEDGATAFLLAMNATFGFWIGSGMETPLQAFLICASVYLYGRARDTGNTVPVAIALGLLGITRPEGPLYAVPIALLWLGGIVTGRRRLDNASLRGVAVYAVIVGGYMSFRFAYFAEVFPNTYFAKFHFKFAGADYVMSFYQTHALLIWSVGAAWVISLAAGRAYAARARVLAALFSVGLFFIWRSRGDWMHEWRFLAPLIPVFCATMGAGVSAARKAASALPGRAPARRILLLMSAGGLAACFFAWRSELGRLDVVRKTGDVSAAQHAEFGAAIKKKANELGMLRPLVAVTDLGGFALGMENAELIDVVGLADYAIAHHAGNSHARADYLVREGLPAFLSAGWGPSRYVSEIPDLVQHYEDRGFGIQVLKGLTSEEDPRCPGGKAAMLVKSLACIQDEIDEAMPKDPVLALALWRCAYTYLPSNRLPPLAWRKTTSHRSVSMGDAAATAGEIERAVRYLSLATILGRGNAWNRRKTEALRARLFSGA